MPVITSWMEAPASCVTPNAALAAVTKTSTVSLALPRKSLILPLRLPSTASLLVGVAFTLMDPTAEVRSLDS